MVGAQRNRSADYFERRAHYHDGRGMRDLGTTAPLIGGGRDREPHSLVTVPPQWVDLTGEMDGLFRQIKMRMTELQELHQRHLQPHFDTERKKAEEHSIEVATNQISRLFGQCQAKVKALSTLQPLDGHIESKEEVAMKVNAAKSYAIQIQDLSQNFKQVQQQYLRRRRGLEEKEKQFGDGLDYRPTKEELDDEGFVDRGFTDSQLALIGHHDLMHQQRSADIQAILRSIVSLQEIFNDLSTLVIEQGTILDQIDQNLVDALGHTGVAVTELEQADKHHKSYRNKLCILLLIVIIGILALVLIFKPKKSS